MENKEKKISFFRHYLKTIVFSFSSAFSIGFGVSLWTATYKLSRIKIGEYPGMPQDQINKQYYEVLPYVILDSILIFLAITIPVSILTLFLKFKYSHNINLYHEFFKKVRKRFS